MHLSRSYRGAEPRRLTCTDFPVNDLDYRAMGSFERFKMKTHFNSLKRLVGVTALAALAVKLLTVALATAAGGGTPLDLLARVPASLADLGAALPVFEVLRTRRPLQLAARSAILAPSARSCSPPPASTATGWEWPWPSSC